MASRASSREAVFDSSSGGATSNCAWGKISAKSFARSEATRYRRVPPAEAGSELGKGWLDADLKVRSTTGTRARTTLQPSINSARNGVHVVIASCHSRSPISSGSDYELDAVSGRID